MMDSAQNTGNLRDRIAAIVRAISDGDDKYWNTRGMFGVLDQDAVVNDILAAVMLHDGETMNVREDKNERF